MNLASLVAQIDGIFRPYLVRLPSKTVTRLYSNNRDIFLQHLVASRPRPLAVPADTARTLWDLTFRSPIFNAAGMFKDGRGYEFSARQGAGAWLAGTTTALPRKGNKRDGAVKPFAPYPASGAALNWQGLPNQGHADVAARLATIERYDNCPIGASLSADPGIAAEDAQTGLLGGLRAYESAGVDFMEINESCPNTEDGEAEFDHMVRRLEFVAEHFLSNRKRRLPVIVKFSNDTAMNQVPDLLKVLIDLKFDGVNFGNTSTAYQKYRPEITAPEQALYDYFSSTFGGGLSGRPLKTASLNLVRRASEFLGTHTPGHEFHIIRTGGIENREDMQASLDAGASLAQWYTGYFEAYALHGDRAYADMYAPPAQLNR